MKRATSQACVKGKLRLIQEIKIIEGLLEIRFRMIDGARHIRTTANYVYAIRGGEYWFILVHNMMSNMVNRIDRVPISHGETRNS